MSSESIVPAGLPPARPGETTCATDGCAWAGSAVQPPRCPQCGNRVHLVPDRQPRPAAPAAPAAPPAQRWTSTAAPVTIGAGEVLSRSIFGGFWALVTAGLLLASFAGMAAGQPQALLALLGAVLTGLYARYIFRGGRFRMLFW
jgi:hypothetical protein